jgi:hypothetical protein
MQNPKEEKGSVQNKKGGQAPPQENKNWFIQKYEEHLEEKAEMQEEFYKKKLFVAAERIKKSKSTNSN